MIVDSSALLAILGREEGSDRLIEVASSATTLKISAGTLLEAGIVCDARSPHHGELLDRLVSELEIEVVPVGELHAKLGRAAYRRFGRGSGSLARLNVGDCLSYALSVAEGEPLLFVGEDFTHTDVLPA